MQRKILIDVILGRPKSYRSSKKVVASVQQGDSLPEGDIGAYLVGVFACQPLTTDSESYDMSKPGQWSHCLYKKKWKATLQGKDEFTDEERALIIAGAELLKDYNHGWGSKAVSQSHVKKILNTWLYAYSD